MNHANLVADIAYKAVNVYTAESRKTGVPTFYKIHYSQLLEIEDMANLRNYAKDKTEFAIEKLERVKEFVEENKSRDWDSYEDTFADTFSINNLKLNDFIDQIIADLKKD